MFMKPALLSVMVFALWCTAAWAVTPVTYKFIGIVTSETGGFVKIGQKVKINIVFDKAYPPSSKSTTEAIYEGGSLDGEPNAILSATFEGQSIPSGINGMDVEKNNAGVTGYFLFSSDPEAGPGFQVSFSSNMASAVRNLKIPRRIVPDDFQSATFSIASGNTEPNYYYKGTIEAKP
jgi:hypothetical protein